MSSGPPSVHQLAPRRRARLQTRIRRQSLDAMLVTHPTNVTYLTGFTGDSSYLWLTAQQAVLLSDTRFATQIQEQCPDLKVEIRDTRSTVVELAAQVARQSRSRTIGIESQSLTKQNYDRLNATLDAELVDTVQWVETLRAVKDRFEIEAIRRSIRINERAFEVIRSGMTGDQSEREIANELEYQIRRLGGEGCSFAPIVAVGDRAALPHAEVTERRIDQSSFVLIDWGARAEGYASDLTRVVPTARIPPKLRKIHEIVLRAQQAAIDAIRPGATLKTVDQAARRVIDEAGFGKRFGHGLGHGIGLEIHELPFLSPIQEGELLTNMVVTVEPGIYLPGWGGVRIEDDVRVTRDGAERLSRLPRALDQCMVAL